MDRKNLREQVDTTERPGPIFSSAALVSIARSSTVGLFGLGVLFALHEASSIVAPMFAAVVVGVVLSRFGDRAQSLGIPPFLAAAAFTAASAVAIVLAAAALTSRLGAFVERAPELIARLYALLGGILREPRGVAAQRPHRPFLQAALAPRHLLAHRVEGLPGEHHDMEAVEGDLRPGEVLGGAGAEGPAHVHGQLLDLPGTAAPALEFRGEGRQRRGVLARGHEEQLAGVQVEEVGRVDMALLAADLIDADPAHRTPVAGFAGLVDVVDDDPPEARVVFAEHRGDLGHAHVVAEQHRQGLKEQGEAAALPRPGNRDLVNAAAVALHPGHPRGEDRLVLPEVEVLPLALEPVVDRAVRRVTLGAGETAATLLQVNGQMEPPRFSGLAFEAAVADDPGAAQREGFGKEVVGVHASNGSHSSPSAKPLSTPNSEGAKCLSPAWWLPAHV